ncbi:FAD-dependent monooxygenase [Streptomyces sp. NPDC015346]|uniref:FAD-dependent monooxygenase n=1 Tax=Streptomyces sp. NPDC015346 TaxID=3364954 RepID=UPI0036FC77EE
MGDTTHAETVVVGGGPVGMLLAAELAGYGVDVLVLEAAAATSEVPKAGTLHARPVQSLARRGYLDAPRAVPEAVGQWATAPFHFGGMPMLTLRAPATEPEVLLKRGQAELEREFEARARERGARVLRGHTVTGVREGPDTVEVVAEGPDGTRTFTGRYLVGADGARSTVRRCLGFASDEEPATVSALMGLVRQAGPDPLPEGWHRTERGWVVTRAFGGGRSRVITLDCTAAHHGRDSAPTVEELSGEASRVTGREVVLTDPLVLSRFSDFTRLVRAFRAGRVFLAGDAAHVHFPVGGQGLGTGLLDALNLGWKLAHAVRGTAGKELLDTYDAERRPAARRVVDNTRAQLLLMGRGPGVAQLCDLVGEMLLPERAGRHIADLVSAQETVFPSRRAGASPWEGRFLTNVPLTERGTGRATDVIRLLRDGRPVLLLLGEAGERYGSEAAGWAHVVRAVRAEPHPSLDFDAALLRPDGHLAWASGADPLRDPLSDPLSDALRAWFGEPR